MLLAHAAAAAVPWQHALYLANGGYWPQRMPVTITNGSAEPAAGEPLALLLPALAGARVESLRVCRADGVELLFDLRDAHGLAKRSGDLSAEDKLIVPVECPAHAATTVFVYAGNLAGVGGARFPARQARRPRCQSGERRLGSFGGRGGTTAAPACARLNAEVRPGLAELG